MSQLDKLLRKVFSNSVISYKEAERLLLMMGYSLDISASHHIFRKEGCNLLSLKPRTGLFPYQKKDLREALIQHGYQKRN